MSKTDQEYYAEYKELEDKLKVLNKEIEEKVKIIKDIK